MIIPIVQKRTYPVDPGVFGRDYGSYPLIWVLSPFAL